MKAAAFWNSNLKSKFSMSDVKLEGFVLFQQENIADKVKIKVYLDGLPDGKHGFHIHEKSMTVIKECNDAMDCCKQLGGHFSVEKPWSPDYPQGVRHGFHNGDLAFNIISENGISNHTFVVDNISLFKKEPSCILDRSLVIHADEDDMGLGGYEDEEKNIESLITGNAGARIACAEIKELLVNEN